MRSTTCRGILSIGVLSAILATGHIGKTAADDQHLFLQGGRSLRTAVDDFAESIAEDHDTHEQPAPRVNTKTSLGTTDPLQPSIYVYDDPAVDWSRLVDCYRMKNGVAPWRDEEGEHAQNMAEVWVHQALLRHPSRTLDPTEASLYYIPLYATVSSDAEPRIGSLRCHGETHQERINNALDYLESESTYFTQFGGADHFFVCAWWRCGVALGNRARVVLSRTILGINESPPENTDWARWECVNRVVTVPYVSSTKIPASLFRREDDYIARERNIPIFFAGRTRDRIERQNLAVISEISPESMIGLSEWEWTEDPVSYADLISHSQFCLCPRGDTMSSRRFFDAVAAGCIPVVTHDQARKGNIPFTTNMDYSAFAVVLPSDSFLTVENVQAVTGALIHLDDATLLGKRTALLEARSDLIYGYSTGDTFDDMSFYQGAVDKLLSDVTLLTTAATLWECDPTPWWEFPADRVGVSLPPTAEDEENWTLGMATVLLREEKVLLCTPPYTGSKPVRHFFQKVQRSRTWEDSGIKEGLDHVTLQNEDLYEVYALVGWVKISMLRDPVTRLLATYLHRSSNISPSSFKTFVMSLYLADWKDVPRAFWPQKSYCGMKHAHFDNFMLFEDGARSKAVLASLPNSIWMRHGQNWNGMGGDVFDVETHDQFKMGFADVGVAGRNQCGKWATYYDMDTLDMVAFIYAEDYEMYKWYTVSRWKARAAECMR